VCIYICTHIHTSEIFDSIISRLVGQSSVKVRLPSRLPFPLSSAPCVFDVSFFRRKSGATREKFGFQRISENETRTGFCASALKSNEIIDPNAYRYVCCAVSDAKFIRSRAIRLRRVFNSYLYLLEVLKRGRLKFAANLSAHTAPIEFHQASRSCCMTPRVVG